MAVTIPNCGWYPRWDPPVHSSIEDRGKTCARNPPPPIRLGVLETAVSLTGEKPVSSAKELPPPRQNAVGSRPD